MKHRLPILEADVLATCLDWLAMKHILHFRINSGAVQGEYKGKSRYVPFVRTFIPGVGYVEKGMTDICALVKCQKTFAPVGTLQTWLADVPKFMAIEVKRLGKESTAEQVRFHEAVRAAGHVAVEVHSLDELVKAMAGEGVR